MLQFRRAARLCLALAAVTATLGFASGALAADNTIRLEPSAAQVAAGGTVNVKVLEKSTVAISGVSASITFDKAVLQVTTITRGSAFAAAPLFLAADAPAIASANKKGKLQNVAAAFFPPANVTAGEVEFITVGFKAIGCGTVKMTVPTGTVDSAMIDGREATYGAALKVTTTGTTVTVCDGAAGSGVPGASADASAGASIDPALGSFDPNASPSLDPAAGGSAQPGGPNAAPSGAPANFNGTLASGTEQSGWLNFAIAALAVAAAGLAVLIIVLTLIAIAAAVVGTIVVIRYWRRSVQREGQVAPATAPAGTADGSAAEVPPVEGRLGGEVPTTVIPLPNPQS